jgi:hypothetical protein
MTLARQVKYRVDYCTKDAPAPTQVESYAVWALLLVFACGLDHSLVRSRSPSSRWVHHSLFSYIYCN